jgi:TonB family protein
MESGTLIPNLLAYSVQVAAIAAIGTVLPLLIRVDATVRHLYWRALLALCVMLPWLQGRHDRMLAGPLVETATTSAFVAGPGSIPAAAAPPGAAFDWTLALVALLAAGTIVRLLRIAASLVHLRRLRATGEAAPASESRDALQRMLGTRAEIRFVPHLRQPVTFGVLKPVVLLPWALRAQAPGIQHAVLCHELVHVQRRDWAWLLAEETIRAVLWFHPAIWWLISRVQLTREEVVDEVAVLATGARRTYIEALMAFADETPLVPAAAFSRRQHLFRRLVLLSKETAMSSTRIVLSGAVMFAAAAVSSLLVIGAFPMARAASAQQTLLPTAGPLEGRARPITPENPIPRRIYSVAPQLPFQAANVQMMTGAVTLKITLEPSGRVGEMRRAGFLFFSRNPSFSAVVTRDPMPSVAEALAQTRASGAQGNAAAATPVIEALFRSAADAVAQWQYEPPAEGPISFFVQLGFNPDGNVSMNSQSVTLPQTYNTAAPVSAPPQGASAGQRGGRAGAAAAVGGQVPIRVGGAIGAPRKIKHVNPVYPNIARSARISGVVILEATIGADGRVIDARVLRSIPLLDQAALDAVRQWEFTPTLLNGVATPIVMTVTVTFSLAEQPPQF